LVTSVDIGNDFSATAERLYINLSSREGGDAWLSGRVAWTASGGEDAAITPAYVGLGDKDGAIEALERTYETHDTAIVSLNSSPIWDPLRADPRFVDLMRRVHLAP
jgi:hypothetical protein